MIKRGTFSYNSILVACRLRAAKEHQLRQELHVYRSGQTDAAHPVRGDMLSHKGTWHSLRSAACARFWAINIALLRSASLGVALFLYKTAIRSMLREVF